MKLLTFITLLLTHLSPAQIRIDPRNFGMPEAELRTLLQPTLALFPPPEGAPKTPLFISHHPAGPITLFQRTPRREIAIRLNSRNRYHAQFIYQFAHELAHVRANLHPDPHQNKWLEETLCEAASLYALRKLSTQWEKNAPNKTLQNYRHHLATYAAKVIATRHPLTPETAPAFYLKHRTTLRANPTNRQLNGALANLILPLLEAHPTHWHALATLPHKKDTTLPQHLAAWRAATPKKHHPFLTNLQTLLLKKP